MAITAKTLTDLVPGDRSSPITSQGAGKYLLGDSTAELQHLVAQAEVYAAEARQLLDEIPLKAGAQVIDVGCGVLGILAVLAERVGNTGRIVGLDREPRILAMAKAEAKRRGLTLEFVEADATSTGLPKGSFDLVHARTLLLNVSNPLEILKEMVSLARPGGIVALQEPDSCGWVCDPPHPAWEILRGELTAAYRRNGKDFDIGRRIGRLLSKAGVVDVRVRSTARATRPGEFYQTFLLTLTTLVRDQILAGHTLTADQLEQYSSSLRAHLETPGTITNQPIVWQAWGRTRE